MIQNDGTMVEAIENLSQRSKELGMTTVAVKHGYPRVMLGVAGVVWSLLSWMGIGLCYQLQPVFAPLVVGGG